MMKSRAIKYTLLFVLLLNTLLPFCAPLMPAAEGKVALCTTEGIRYVDASEIGLSGESEETHFPHCPLCVLNGDVAAKSPVLAACDAGLKAPKETAVVFDHDEVAAQDVAHFNRSAPRAPPTFL
jgi:hypothetical protein